MVPITSHNQPFEPTYPRPETDEQKRILIAEIRSLHKSGYFPHESWPVPEWYPGQLEDKFGLSSPRPCPSCGCGSPAHTADCEQADAA